MFVDTAILEMPKLQLSLLPNILPCGRCFCRKAGANKTHETNKVPCIVNSYVGVDIASIPDLFTNAHSDPTFEKAYHNLRLEALRKAYQTLSDDERKLLCLYYYHELSMEEIGRRLGVTKMAISKRLRKTLDHLRGLTEDGAP